MRKGILITFEGIEGCGKSTQLELLADHLQRRGTTVMTTREPGGTRLGERARELLVDPASDPVPLAELFLLESARAQLVEKIIAPALAGGAVVLCDRFADSSLAYQGGARGLGWELVARLNALACGDTRPTRTVLLEVPLEVALARARAATAAASRRFEDEDEEFHRAVSEGFRRLQREEPHRVVQVDGTGAPADVHARVLNALAGVLG